MDKNDYEYSGLMAQFWDLLRGDTSRWEDRFFYQDVIRQHGQPALDVGCGTGRLLLDYMQQGIDIDGVDYSPEMLDLLRQKAAALGLSPRVALQTMETLDLPRRYRVILVPSSSFQLLTEPAAAAEALRRFYRHLEPGGVLVMSLYILGVDDAGQPIDQEEWTKEVVRPEDGAIIRRWSRSVYDHAQQMEDTEDRYEVIVDSVVVASEQRSRPRATRGYSQAQAIQLLQDAGFSDVHLTSGFSCTPAAPKDTLFCVFGTRP
jgi:ubiquinone/menaquinone biosynthesis C-methylase UbiE